MERVISELLDFSGVLLGSLIVGNLLNNILTPGKKKWMGLVFFSLSNIITHGLFLYCKNFDSIFPAVDIKLNLKFILVIGVWAFYVFYFFTDSIKKKLKTYICLEVFTMFFEIMTSLSIGLIYGDNYDLIMADGSILKGLTMFYMLIFIYLITSICTYIVCKRFELKAPTVVLILFGILVFIACLAIGFAANIIIESDNKTVASIFYIVPVLFIMIYILNYYLVLKLGEKEILKERLLFLENIKLVNLSYYEDVQKKYDEVRKIRHDLKDSIETVKILVDSGNKENLDKAKEILKGIGDKVESTKIQHFTDNIVVNTIVSNEADNAAKREIKFDANIDIPKEITTISLVDLNCVYLNLLRNAIEATEKLPEGSKKYVEVKSGVAGGYLIIKTINTFDLIKKNADGELVTTKDDTDKHGIGISIIKEIANKYNGKFELKFNDDVCVATVAMKI